ncbi:MAG: SDR family NAD(P)-dependent oxidoreductase [Pseudomonadota bacterium]
MPFSHSPYNALVIGASGGIGAALASAIDADPSCANLETLSRSQDGFDVLDEGGIHNAAATLRARNESFDLIINATGALEINGAGPEKSFKEIDPGVMGKAFQINAVGAALVIKHFSPLLRRDWKSVFATLSARVGSIGDNRLGGWVSYRASKAALNQIVRCAAVEIARANKDAVVAGLHPGTIDTPMTEKFAKGRYTATPEECAENLLGVLAALSPKDSGGFFDYAGEAIPW